MRKHLPLTLAALCAGAFLFPSAAMAQGTGEIVNGGFGVGLGYAEPEEGDGDFLALVQYRGESWEVEFNYIFGDSDAWILSGNYIFNFDRDLNDPATGAYAGIGYSYIGFDGDGGDTGDGGSDNDSGFNVMLGYDIDQDWAIEGRYIFSDPNVLTITVTYNFGAETE